MSEDDDSFEFEEYDASPHESAFIALRTGIAFVSEYRSVAAPDTKLAWAVEDLRGEVMDLVEALLDNDHRRISRTTVFVQKLIRSMFGDI